MYEVYDAFHNVALKSETSTKVSRKYVCIFVRMYVKEKNFMHLWCRDTIMINSN